VDAKYVRATVEQDEDSSRKAGRKNPTLPRIVRLGLDQNLICRQAGSDRAAHHVVDQLYEEQLLMLRGP